MKGLIKNLLLIACAVWMAVFLSAALGGWSTRELAVLAGGGAGLSIFYTAAAHDWLLAKQREPQGK